MPRKKKTDHEFQMKYAVTAVVAVTVTACDAAAAKLKADQIMKDKVFSPHLDVLDEVDEYVGYDDMTLWDRLKT